MNRLLPLGVAAYLAHLIEEGFARMYDDPIIVAAFGPLSQLPPRQATYLVFQVTFALALMMIALFSLGGGWRAVVVVGLGLALLAEAHHLVRALASQRYNAGLVTSLPLPFLGAFMLRAALRELPPPTPKGVVS